MNILGSLLALKRVKLKLEEHLMYALYNNRLLFPSSRVTGELDRETFKDIPDIVVEAEIERMGGARSSALAPYGPRVAFRDTRKG